MAIVKGIYRDIILENDILLLDTGWKSNKIQEDFGIYLAALLKKNFNKVIGIEYLVVGGPLDASTKYPDNGDCGDNGFGERIHDYFKEINNIRIADLDFLGPLDVGKFWVCAVKPDISFVPSGKDINDKESNKLQISYTFPKEALSQPPYHFREFSLVGSELNAKEGKNLFGRIYVLNYVAHGLYTKDEKVSLKREITLTFPL